MRSHGLLLFLLCGGSHLFAESHVGNLEIGNSADADREDDEEKNRHRAGDEYACKHVSYGVPGFLDVAHGPLTLVHELVLLEQR